MLPTVSCARERARCSVPHTTSARSSKCASVSKDGIGHTRGSGQEFNVTRERIRQIEAEVLQKLRDHPRSACIREHGTGKTQAFTLPSFVSGNLCPECRKAILSEIHQGGKTFHKCDRCAYTMEDMRTR